MVILVHHLEQKYEQDEDTIVKPGNGSTEHEKSSTLRIGAKLGWFVIADTRLTQADISRKIVSSRPQSTR